MSGWDRLCQNNLKKDLEALNPELCIQTFHVSVSGVEPKNP